jgi:hypothetical protein
MPIYNGGGGVSGITVEEDPSALKMAQNLADLQNFGTARTNLDVYSKGETNTQIGNSISNIPAYAPPSIALDYNVTPNYTPSRSVMNNGTIIVLNSGTGGPTTIYLDVANGWQVGDRFMFLVEGGTNGLIDVGSGNYINGSGNTHAVNGSNIHWVTLIANNGTAATWSAH